MQGAVKEKWLELCELAASEQDPKKLMVLVQEITRLLEEKEQRLKARSVPDQSSNK
jgi:hypothetical protein